MKIGEKNMSVYKDNTKKGSWFVSCYYTNYQGHRKQKLKRGFNTKREAKKWERDFLDRLSLSPDMLFKSLVARYLDDCNNRLKIRTLSSMTSVLDKHIMPYFSDIPLNKITPATVRNWQNNIESELSISYKNYVYTILSSIFNFACQYYNLQENPCKKVGKLKGAGNKRMSFYTLKEYKLFCQQINDMRYKMIFDLLFYCGLRIGELLALTFKDISLDNKTIDINKSFCILRGQEIITSPKTKSSIRIVTIPDFLALELREYMSHCYDRESNTRLFILSASSIREYANRCSKAAGLNRIRLHDFRHSHVALLVELGENPLLIANRLGHSDIKMTLNTYAHLYPNKQNELAKKLDNL